MCCLDKMSEEIGLLQLCDEILRLDDAEQLEYRFDRFGFAAACKKFRQPSKNLVNDQLQFCRVLHLKVLVHDSREALNSRTTESRIGRWFR